MRSIRRPAAVLTFVALVAPALVHCSLFGATADPSPTSPATTAVPLGTPCHELTNCGLCVSDYKCGWCSNPVSINGTNTTAHCAGAFDGFTCNGIFSRDVCEVGYECDLNNFECKKAGAGKGEHLAKCRANCTNLGQVYKCDQQEGKCTQVAQGTPGSASYHVCEATCKKPVSHRPVSQRPVSHSPHSPKPHTQPPAVYSCNETIGTCEVAKPGTGTSKSTCEQGCKKVLPGHDWFCNSITHKCEKAPKGFPSTTKAVCLKKCKPPTTAGPPAEFLGLWRGLLIQNGYTTGEWDLQFTETTVKIVDILNATTIVGTPSTVTIAGKTELWIDVTSPGSTSNTTIKAIGQANNRGPETMYLTAALSYSGNAPRSIDDAMTTHGDQVFFLAKCAGTPECHFTLPSTGGGGTFSSLRLFEELRRSDLYGAMPVAYDDMLVQEDMRSIAAETKDACSQYGSNCSSCLAHPPCGWCSTKVTYPGGVTGTQCAGFSKDDPYVCRGRFSRQNCTQGFICNHKTLQCEQNASPGNGFPAKECEELCIPTPKPTPKPPQYTCNITTRTCHKCDSTTCPGSMPQAACRASCAHPKKGPTALVKGLWRGLQIQKGYYLGEVTYDFGNETLTVYHNGKEAYTANVTSFGGDEMILDVMSGVSKGKKLSVEYTVANIGAGLYAVMTLGMSAPNGAIPSDYSGPMQTTGQKELVMAKCNDAPCKFVLET